MKKLLKTLIVLITLGCTTASIFAAKDLSNDNLDLLNEDISDIDLASLEDELKRLLAEEEDISDIESLEAQESSQESSNEPIVSEEETLVINPTPKNDEAQELVIKYEEPLTKSLEKELATQPNTQEVIILDEIGENNKDVS